MEVAKFKDRVLKSGSVCVFVALVSAISGPVNATWDPIGPMPGPAFNDFDGFATGSAAARIIYGASSTTSLDNGAWKLSPSGPPWTGWARQNDPQNYVTIAVQPSGSGNVAVAGVVGGGIRYTLDGGTSWTNSSGAATHENFIFSYSKTSPNIVFAGMRNAPGQLLKSLDGGASWTAITSGADSTPQVGAVAVDPNNANIVYAGVDNSGGAGGVWKSVNGGNSWARKTGYPFTDVGAIAIDPRDTGIIYAGSANSGKLQRSTDGGETWQEVTSTLTNAATSMFAITINPANSRVIYAGGIKLGASIPGFSSVIASSDCGKTWNYVDDTNLSFGALRLKFDGSSRVLAASFGGGVFAKDAIAASTAAADACPVSGANTPPTANAGPNQTVDEGASVTLNGSGSADSDGTIAANAYAWTQTDSTGITATLTGANTVNPTFTAPAVTGRTVLRFSLVVTDDDGANSDADTVNVTVNNVVTGGNNRPTANAGPDQTVNEGASVTLNGSGSADNDGTIAANAYAWRQTSGPSVGSLANSSTPGFTAPAVTATTVLTFSLVVTDDDAANSTADTVNVTVDNVGDDKVPSTAKADPISDFDDGGSSGGGGAFGQILLPLMMLFSIFGLLRSRKTRV
jgi:hypothetical protein